jgi:hypothetical protein
MKMYFEGLIKIFQYAIKERSHYKLLELVLVPLQFVFSFLMFMLFALVGFGFSVFAVVFFDVIPCLFKAFVQLFFKTKHTGNE